MDMYAAYLDLGTLRGTAAICGANHHTFKREVLKQLVGADGPASDKQAQRTKNTVIVAGLVAKRVGSSNGRISAKRLLPATAAAGYTVPHQST